MNLFRNKLCLALLGLAFLQTPVMADNDEPISFEQLPLKAQTLLKQDFADFKIAFAEKDKDVREKGYEVKFTNGGSIEFNKKGEWKEIDCKNTAVPAKFIPQPILKQVRKKWGQEKIVKIERDHKKIKVELASDIEITFNKNFKIIEIDD